MDKYQTFIDRLAEQVTSKPEKTAFTFLQDGETESGSLSYHELSTRAAAIAAVLQSHNATGERALLLYQPGLEFITTFLGCLYAGVIAVPAYPPRANRSIKRLLAIVADADAKFALTTEDLKPKIEQKFREAGQESLQFLATDQIENSVAAQWQKPNLTRDDLAFLQYTSGSTGTPKGVMVSNGNLLENSASIQKAFQNLPSQRILSWLPPYHDMGLIGGILQPIYVGSCMYLLPPVSFLQRPYRWLQAISKYRATTSGGPNFAYDLCVSQISEEQRDNLDLSCWQLAFSGAEPVRAKTIQEFSDYFHPAGFQKRAFYPCYGMAESTLLITGGSKQTEPIVRDFDKKSIEQNRAISHNSAVTTKDEQVTLVSSGANIPHQSLAIANPDNLEECSEGKIGEIWAASASVGKGYWNRPELTQYAFGAQLENYPNVTFLRTGDLGFIQDGQLFVTGRLKDLIIIRGRNHYPQDIELTVDNAHEAVRQGNGAAFSVEIEGEEKLVVTQEIKRTYLRKLNVEEVTKAIRQAILENHELNPHALVLIKTASIPKTSSGKIQRHACKAGFLDGSLKIVGKSKVKSQKSKVRSPKGYRDPFQKLKATQNKSNHQQETIEAWLVGNIAQRLGVNESEIDIEEPFAGLGLDSVQAVRLSADLEDYLDLKLSPTLVYDYPHISSLASYLSQLNSNTIGETSRLLQQTRPKNQQAEIAIIGMGCRFPGANNPQEFWNLLQDGENAITKSDRWAGEDYGGFISNVDKFDPQFFGITPRETQRMDPQQRLLLEVSWSALEDAAIAPENLSNTRTGVFIGISSNDYSQLQFHYGTKLDAYAGTGNAHSIAANRLSYSLDLRGPSMTVDTACSSSLVAVHLACQSLRNGECQTAIAGGVNLMLSPELTETFSLAGMMAADGRCKTFDADADGYVRGEGCGVIILKALDDAIRDRNNILAVIKGSAINQDGRSNGLTAPNSLAQQEVIQQAIANAGINAQDISHIEAHGTGTKLGDPIEVNSLKAVLAGQENTSCYLTSVKTNIGHLEAAAGIAGLIKTVLSLQNEAIPPHKNFKSLNPLIDLADTSLSIPTNLQSWKASEKPRLAGISSFGFGGTNAHVILQDKPKRCVADTSVQNFRERSCNVLTLSAKNESALQDLVVQYQNYLHSHPDVALEDLCYTANIGRSHFNHRLAITSESTEQLQEKITNYLSSQNNSGIVSNGSKKNKLAWLFTGQGSQYEGMGAELYQTQPIFRQTLDYCAEILQPYIGVNLIDIIYPKAETNNEVFLLNQTKYTQPAIFALEYSLAQIWLSWGVEPDLVMGHSVGEYVAAAIAGVFSLEDGLKLIAERGNLMQALPNNGGMFAVLADEHKVTQIIEPYQEKAVIAAINGGQNIVISGENEVLEQVVGKLDSQGITYKQLTVSHAFHSPLMQPILADFTQVAQTIEYQQPQINLISNVTGDLINDEVAKPEYWVNHVMAPVKFAQGIKCLQQQECNIFLEVGSKPILLGMSRSILENSDSNHRLSANNIICLPSLRPRKSDWTQITKSLASLYLQGIKIDWQGFDQGYVRNKLQLPTYPFQRQSYWLEKNNKVQVANLFSKQEKNELDYYQIKWQEYIESPAENEFSEGKWIIFGDADNLGTDIVQQLATDNQDYLLVSNQENISIENSIYINYNNPTDFQRVFPQKSKIQGIIYLWSLDGLDKSELSTKDIEDYQQRNCTSILNIIQTLFRQSVIAPVWIVTRNIQSIESSLSSVLSNSLWGLGKVIASEHPEYYGGIIDLNNRKSTTEAKTILDIVNSPSKEDYLAVQQDKILVPRLEKTKSINKQPLTISANGYYLITGGLGALGLQVANWLVEKGAKNLVLVSRSQPQEKVQQIITELESEGVTIEIFQTDITDYNALKQLLLPVPSAPLRGVIHAAGVLDDGILQNQTWEKFNKVLAPKVIGAWNLHQCTKDLNLDFFVMFSSVASLVGSPGQGNYAAANASLDAIANYRQSIGLPALSINWSAWANSGMAVNQGFNRQGLELINPQQGLAALEELLTTNAAQVGVMSVDWDELSKQFPYLRQANYFSELLTTTDVEEEKTGDIYNELLELDAEAREEYLRAYLHNAIANILQIEPSNLSLSESLFDLGMDSLMLMEAINQLKDDLQLMLYPREFYERPRIDSLAKYLANEFTNSVTIDHSSLTIDHSTLNIDHSTLNNSQTDALAYPKGLPSGRAERYPLGNPLGLTPNTQPQIKEPITFILSSPRSGSTLLRVMLAGHPEIASPPELHLLPFSTMAARQEELDSSYLGEGLQRAFMELKGIDAEESQKLVSELVQDNLSVSEVYQMLQELAGDHLLIDKSPTYASNRATLNQAEAIFSNAKYIHLVRHPYAVIESFARMRMDKLIGQGNSNPYQLAESIWHQSNRNILDFAKQIDQDKLLLVHYEELVAHPEKVMRQVCEFLGVAFDSRVLTPYKGDRMTDGVNDKSMSIGDPNFLKRKQIDPEMANAWRKIKLPLLLNDLTQYISAKLDYELPQEVAAADTISELDHKMEEILVNIRGLRVCLCTWGPKEGPIVVCLHGILDQGAAWSEVAIRLAQKGYRVIAPDLRGHGKSDRVGKGGSYNLMDFLGDIDAIVEALAGKAFTLVGHSLGSVVAAIFASVRPQLVKNLVLIETILPTDTNEEDAAEQLATHLDYLASPPQHPIFPDVEAAAERLRQATPGLSRAIAMMLAERITEPYGDGVRWRWEPLLRTRAGIGFNGIGRSRYLGLLKRIKAPITLVYGDKSSFNRNEDLTEQQAAMPNAKRVMLSGGHNLPLEEPNGIAKIISGAIALTSKLIP